VTEEIEERAERLLAEVPDYVWDGKSLPVPVEDIADTVFRLLIRDEEDMSLAPGAPALGAGDSLSGLLLPASREIWVNAHEAGQWPGRRRFTNSGTDISGFVTITARTGEKEVSNILVPNGTPGYEIGEPYRKMGWNASDTRPLSFDDVRVPEENLVGPKGAGFRQFMNTLDGGRISVSAMGVGLAQGALDEALSYAKERQAFGQSIAKYQAIQVKLADMSAEIEAARLLTYKAALEKDAGKNFTLTAAQAKLKTGRLAVRASEEAVQIHGGYGYIEEYPVCRFYRDAKILTIGEGTDEVLQMVIARQLGC